MLAWVCAAGLCSLQELVLDGNRISSLHPLGGLSGLQVLTAAHNCITALDDIEVRLPLGSVGGWCWPHSTHVAASADACAPLFDKHERVLRSFTLTCQDSTCYLPMLPHDAFFFCCQGLSSLRRLDVAGNQLRRIEVLAACRGRTMLTSLNVSGNPLEAAQDARLHIVHLLTQVGCCGGLFGGHRKLDKLMQGPSLFAFSLRQHFLGPCCPVKQKASGQH